MKGEGEWEENNKAREMAQGYQCNVCKDQRNSMSKSKVYSWQIPTVSLQG